MMPSFEVKQRLLIDPYYQAPSDTASDVDFVSPPSSYVASLAKIMSGSSSSRTPSSSGSQWKVCFVLCMYDFSSSDQDHLSFRKGEILEIVKQEDSGWWAALREDKLGWVPSAYLQPIADSTAAHLRNIREDARVVEYNSTETTYLNLPVLGSPDSPPLRDDEWNGSSQYDPDVKVPSSQVISPTGLVFVEELSYDTLQHRSPPQSPPRKDSLDALSSLPASSPEFSWKSRIYPPSPTAPMPHPFKPQVYPLQIHKPSPVVPSPVTPAGRSSLSRSRSSSSQSMRSISHRHKPSAPEDASPLSKQWTGVEQADDELTYEIDDGRYQVTRHRGDKVKQLTGDDDAQAFHNARIAQANSPWYLQPTYGSDQIKLEYDGSVRAGTLRALVERLTVDPLKLAQETLFRHTFLTTFHTFTDANTLFDLLVERYSMDHPGSLTTEEFEEWKEKKLRPVQKRVLTVLSLWLEEYGLLQDNPHIAPRLREFLSLILDPSSLALTAKYMVQSLDRLRAAEQTPPALIVTPSKRKKVKLRKNDFLRLDPVEIALQLSLYEQRLYIRIRPRECLSWAKTQRGEAVFNLAAFCSTHDKLACWVKSSILSNDSLGKRADIIDMWIKIAEKCRQLNNFSSMSAIVAALSSSVLSRLHLTWALVTRGNYLQILTRLTEPTGNFQAQRALYQSLEGPCVPFVGMYLTDIVHVNDQLKDVISFVSSKTPSTPPLINFVKRQKWYEAAHAILKYQNKTHNITENSQIMSFLEAQLSFTSGSDQQSLWARSQQLQQDEVAHADIRRGLEAAGF